VVHRQDRVGVSAGQTHASQDHPQQDQRGAIRPSRTAPRSSRGHHDANRGYHRAGRGRDASTRQRRFSCVAVRGALRRAAPLLRATTGMTSSDEKNVPNFRLMSSHRRQVERDPVRKSMHTCTHTTSLDHAPFSARDVRVRGSFDAFSYA
jgi:hypothetical protein